MLVARPLDAFPIGPLLMGLACAVGPWCVAADTAGEDTGKLRLGAPFTNHAVLQQGIPLPIWGTAPPGAAITVAFAGQERKAVAGPDGRWAVSLAPLAADRLASVNQPPVGRPLVVTAESDGARQTAEAADVVVGEVWLCAGQSNIAGAMRTNTTRHHPPDSIEKASYPGLRQWASDAGEWLVCSPATAPSFKKVGFFFGRELQREILVPVGIVSAAVGGSSIESWHNREPYGVGDNYRRFIEPLAGYGIRGTVWYQGEGNEADRRAYGPKLQSLIHGWRAAWRQADAPAAGGPRGEFSFLIVQLAAVGRSDPDDATGGDGRAEIRNAQFEALAVPHTGMSVAIDVGDVAEHPPNKYDTGVRLARWALHHDYGRRDVVPSGPLFKSFVVEGNRIRVRFDHAEHGLMLARKEGFEAPTPTPDAAVGWLSIRDRVGVWHRAKGAIDGADLIVSAAGVTEPTAVRYAFTQHPSGCNLYNTDGLPASPFSTCGYDP